MKKIDTFVDTPENCLKVRDVRFKHFVVLENNSADNFEIAFAHYKSDRKDDYYGLFFSSSIPMKEIEKYTDIILKYAQSKYTEGKRQEKREKMIRERFGSAGLLSALNCFFTIHNESMLDRWLE